MKYYVLIEMGDYGDPTNVIGVFDYYELAEKAFIKTKTYQSPYTYYIEVFKKNSCEFIERIELWTTL